MVNFNFLTLALVVVAVQGAPVVKRIAQNIVESTAQWEKACLAAGGALRCNPVSVTSFTTLLAAAGPCEQQDAADSMVDLAKTLGSDPDMIRLAQIFAQQPRNTPTSQSVPYCQVAPKNSELDGLFQCQFATANPAVFVGGAAIGDAGTIPLGSNAVLSPAGSCKANPSGPIPDGTQLSDLTRDSGASGSSDSTSNSSGEAAGSSASESGTYTTTTSAVADETIAATSASGFALQNGVDAQKLNAKFASLTASSSCQDGEQACIDDSFALCVDGSFVLATCGAGLICAALPLVNKAGTSLTCTTVADAQFRITASGAPGGLTGTGSDSPASATSTAFTSETTNNAASSGADVLTDASSATDFKVLNGQDAQKLNASFSSLTASSSCQEGQNACVDGAFAQCVGGSFVLTQCNTSLTCLALPLVNSRGTSITCTTDVDAQARIVASGAEGGISG